MGALAPLCDKFQTEDPRRAGQSIGLVAFYYPGRDTLWDNATNSGFLGNFYDISPEKMTVLAKGVEATFTNAESAFQASSTLLALLSN